MPIGGVTGMDGAMLLIRLSVAIYMINVEFLCEAELLKASTDLLKKELERMNTNGIRCPVDLHLSHLDYMRLNADKQKTASCLIRYLRVNKEQGWAWSSLGDVYQRLDLLKFADVCFEQASKLDGSVVSFIRGWHFLGPFVVGKSEIDGDPVEFFGGIQNVSKTRFSSGIKYYSELASNGEVHWIVFPESKGLYVSINPVINWGDLVNSLGSMGITEWQGWVVGDIAVNEDDLQVSVRCLGVHTALIDGFPVAGDIYRREQFSFPVTLSRGLHMISVRGRTKGSLQFRCDINPLSSSFKILKPPFVFDVYNGRFFSKYFSLLILNMDASKWLQINEVTLTNLSPVVEGVDVSVALKDDGTFALAPGQTRPFIIELIAEDFFISEPCTKVVMTVLVHTSLGSAEFVLPFRCRTVHESFLFTFIDHDGSLQHAAAIEPLEPCHEKLCPVVLTLHGTTVPPRNQADSYKRMVHREFVFGLEKAWILAPTRQGAHNWEGPGALTAIAALREFAIMTESCDWMPNKASPDFVIFAGHSMGGHGAWHLATHYPDMALAVVSLAGWIKKEEYGDSNLFFRHDVSNSHVSPRVKSIIEDCITENEADRHASNLKGISVMMRIGADDRTIHPYFNRRMHRILKEWRVNVTYVEIKGKEHWWWDSIEANDGGCVNDEQLRNFMNFHAEIPVSENSEYCVKTERNTVECSSVDLYTSSIEFTVSLINTAFMGSVRGVQVMQQILPHQPSSIQVTIRLVKAVLKTENVRLFLLKSDGIRSFNWRSYVLQIDSSEFDFHQQSSSLKDEICFCLDETGSSWSVCSLCGDLEGKNLRGPLTVGPARRVAESKFIIVAGTQSLQNGLNEALLSFAVYIANLFYLTSDAVAYVMRDNELSSEVADEFNLIIVGGPDENLFTQKLLDGVPISMTNTSISVGKCNFQQAQTGALFLAPHSNYRRLALVLAGNSLEGLKDVVSLAAPTIPPMTRSPFSNLIPDFVITGPDFRSRGYGGFSCCGFWDSHWGLKSELISCSNCV